MLVNLKGVILIFIDIAVSAEPLLNSLLSDDVLDQGYVSKNLSKAFLIANLSNDTRNIILCSLSTYDEG
jgi:hypothetical protein